MCVSNDTSIALSQYKKFKNKSALKKPRGAYKYIYIYIYNMPWELNEGLKHFQYTKRDVNRSSEVNLPQGVNPCVLFWDEHWAF